MSELLIADWRRKEQRVSKLLIRNNYPMRFCKCPKYKQTRIPLTSLPTEEAIKRWEEMPCLHSLDYFDQEENSLRAVCTNSSMSQN